MCDMLTENSLYWKSSLFNKRFILDQSENRLSRASRLTESSTRLITRLMSPALDSWVQHLTHESSTRLMSRVLDSWIECSTHHSTHGTQNIWVECLDSFDSKCSRWKMKRGVMNFRWIRFFSKSRMFQRNAKYFLGEARKFIFAFLIPHFLYD